MAWNVHQCGLSAARKYMSTKAEEQAFYEIGFGG